MQGEPDRSDLTFSMAKSFLSSTAGLAWDSGMRRGDFGDLPMPALIFLSLAVLVSAPLAAGAMTFVLFGESIVDWYQHLGR